MLPALSTAGNTTGAASCASIRPGRRPLASSASTIAAIWSVPLSIPPAGPTASSRRRSEGRITMTSFPTHRIYCCAIVAALATVTAIPAFAQQARTGDSERISVAGGLDFRNAYMLRGVRQDDTDTISWPSAEVGLRLHAADRGRTSARVRVGTFNSVHNGWAGSSGPSGKAWYESDIYTTLSLAFANTLAIDTTFTHY